MKALSVLVVALAVTLVEPHGYLKSPLARTSIHRMPNEPYRPPYYYDDTGVWCANVHQAPQVTNCGRCGGPVGDNDFNQGGAYDKGEITGNYSSGSIIDVVGTLTANHRGYFEVELCTSENENDGCFTRLPIVGGSMPIRVDNRICVGGDHQNHDVTARVQLPPGFRCNRCSLRWTYRTSYPPADDACYNPNPAQTFRNCADIRIQ